MTAGTTLPPSPPAPGGGGEARPRPAPAAAPLVSAVLVVRNGATWLAECLDALGRQTQLPARVVVVDVASTDGSAAILAEHRALRHAVRDVRVVRTDAVLPTGRAIDVGIAQLPATRPDASEWVWVLHDDSAPQPAALERLVDGVRRSQSVGVAGPKLVGWEDPRRLVELGIQVTRTGRRLASPARGESDQGQHDGRTDVLAVSTSGMLVRRSVHAELGGFDPAFEHYGADLDFGWRAQLAGHRVIVVPGAVVREATAGRDGARPGGPGPAEVERRSRRAARQVALARCSPVAAPFLALWMALSAVVASATLLVAKRPRAAWRELADLGALGHPLAVTRARWRGRRSKHLRRDHLSTLFVRPGAAARSTIDHISDAMTPEGRRRRDLPVAAGPSTETGPVADEAESLHVLPASLPRRIATSPGVLAVAAVLLATAAAWRVAIRAGGLSVTSSGLAGGELRPVTSGSSGLWHAFADAWHGAGLGSAADSGPHLAVLAGLTWAAERLPGVGESRSPAGVTIAWLLFLAPALSAWAAYLAGRVVTTSRVTRGLAALAWGTSGVVTTAVLDGRVTVVLAHLLLPVAGAGFALVSRRDGTFTAAFATALAVAVLGAFVPLLLVVALVAAVLLLVLGPGARRLRALVLLVVPPALLGPWLLRFVDDWRLLLSGPGLVTTEAPPVPWLPLLGVPEPAQGPWVWVLAPVVALGLLGLAVRSRSRSEAVGLAAAAALMLLGLALAEASGRLVLGSAPTSVGVSSPARPWSGIGVDLWVLGLLVGLLAGARVPLGRLRAPGRSWRTAVAVLLVALPAGSALALAGRWGAVGLGPTLTVGEATLPAVAVEQGAGPLGNRLLLLQPSERVVDFRLLGQEPGEVLRDLDRPSAVDRPDAAGAGSAGSEDAGLTASVAKLVGGRGAESLDASGLARLGIAYVQVRADPDAGLPRRLDAAGGLTRLGTSEHGMLWKVQPLPSAPGATAPPAPSRVRLVDGADRLLAAVPMAGPHGAVGTTVPAVDPGAPGATGTRYVVVAEPASWSASARVSVDGRVIAPLPGREQPTYAVPAGGGHLEIDLAAAEPWWRLAQGGLLGLVLFLAVPFGNRRSRSRS
ncbi:MAG TPA: glycosyltransferase family 2 protein [Intrasporangium sp.]|uniref:glycosyltransferase family 2 protein n=1 Tax=Intrasporangium sp. TaxID=1925024 RepID=UPI002D7758BE|nr:glycosyltransferase family 2 protein [Intrasporangium sp.]HET7398328.1 glycosyltransferase family 2 protein [Intrasporangium sp.]